jgi:hypothetical protein
MTKNILIATPCNDMVYSHYTNSIVNNLNYLYSHSKEIDAAFTYQTFLGTYIHESRNKIVSYAKNMEASHIIWVDSDMFFPPNTFFDLIKHDLDFVGANYSTRRHPFKYTAGVWDEKNNQFNLVATTPDNAGLQEVDAVGFGLCMTSIECFDDNKKPWFYFKYDEKQDGCIGEDYSFCLSLKDREDIQIFIDHDISKSTTHMGSFPFHHMCPYQNI